jgi:hypothetical protein
MGKKDWIEEVTLEDRIADLEKIVTKLQMSIDKKQDSVVMASVYEGRLELHNSWGEGAPDSGEVAHRITDLLEALATSAGIVLHPRQEIE